jgi:hypothetical protein
MAFGPASFPVALIVANYATATRRLTGPHSTAR